MYGRKEVAHRGKTMGSLQEKKLTCAQKKMQNLISVGAEVRKVFELRPPKACRGKIGLKFKFTGLPTFSNTGYSDTVRK